MWVPPFRNIDLCSKCHNSEAVLDNGLGAPVLPHGGEGDAVVVEVVGGAGGGGREGRKLDGGDPVDNRPSID